MIMDNHDEYPTRISPLKIKYTEYNKKRKNVLSFKYTK